MSTTDSGAERPDEPSDRMEESTCPPDALSLALEGWPPSPTYFAWEEGRLSFCHLGKVLSVVPSKDGWREFWKACDEVDVWSWPPTIGDLGVLDGLFFELRVARGPRSVASSGQVVGSPSGFHEQLMRLHQALKRLAGLSE